VLLEAPSCELVSNEGGKFSLVGEMVLACDADSVYAMLTDYLASPRIFSTVDSVRVDEMDDGRLLVQQSCRWRFLVFGGAFPCQLAVSEEKQRRYMEVELHKKGFIREFEGSWTVTEEPTLGGVRVRHTLALRPALTPPYAHKIFLKQIREILQDVENEVAAWDGRGYVVADDATVGGGRRPRTLFPVTTRV
jgi:ribosome-associated toxin RatA of RatAB toxin-antitoxin module